MYLYSSFLYNKSMIEQRIKSLIENRTHEAIRKELSKKLLTIVRAFGKPIIEQIVPYTSLPNFWETEAPEIPEISDDSIQLRGYYFDGLSRGINLCIKVTMYDNFISELSCDYNGYRVFTETEGEIRSYAPFTSGEEAVDRLHSYAVPVDEEKTRVKKQEKKEADKKKALTIMQKLRLLWGI